MPTEMTDSANPSAQQDESAVAAVRGGDTERYRELVERHERRVFAVAWSRLGDAALAEEATQEAFIRAYRRLWLLGDGAKFSGWVNTIARRISINSGLRHRRELNKRERWALENPDNSTTENSTNETDSLHTPETLRQTLAELPAAHRECLVLFYLEGKSGAETAAALGISEAALRVRLHRARAAMRERLEEKLAESLEQLRPSRPLAAAIMGTILTSSPAKIAGGGVGAKIFYYLLPVKFFFLFMWAIMILPNLLLSLVTTRMEQRNFRDPEGFRARIYRKSSSRKLWLLPLLLALPWLVIYFGDALRLLEIGNIKTLFLGIALLSVFLLFFSARKLVINRDRLHITTFLSSLIMIPGWLAIGLDWLPVRANSTIMMFYILFFIIGRGAQPLRMDYNLFRRALQKMLETVSTEKSPDKIATSLNKSQLLEFARFLGNRLLVVDYLWRGQGLILRLPPLKTSLWDVLGSFCFYSISGRRFSYLLLEWNGAVSVQLGIKDEEALLASQGRALPGTRDLEKQVAVAVESAWRHFRNGDSALAERVLGQVPEADIFILPPARSKAVRLQRGVMIFFLALMLILNGLIFFKPSWMQDVRPVNVTGAQVREFMSLVSTNPNPMIKTGNGAYTQNGFAFDPRNSLFGCLVLPGTNLFTPQGLQAVHLTILGCDDLEKWRQNPKRLQLFVNSQYHRAIYEGLVSWPELNLKPADCEAFLHTNRSLIYSGAFLGTNWDRFLSRCDAWSWVKSQHYDVMRIQNWGVWDLRFLSEVNSLDLVDREKLIQQIASVQTLSANPPGNPPIHDWRDVRGLFFTPCFPALQDTYNSLAALDILGGMDKIDREACIEGILKRHAGKGYFTSPDSGGYNEYHIDGSTRDTIAAFESLRILGALDRVKDLDKWQFRVASYNSSKPDANGVRVLTWDEIEAWVCQQRLEKILRERKENPKAPIGSLLQPGGN
jgi:RNA polymerase sigma-70 factor (ECF subfamily)